MSTLRTPVLKIAPPYDDDLIRRIEQGFSNKLKIDVHFEVNEDPSLLCGFVAYVNGIIYDTSGKTRLADIKEYLLDSALVPPAAKEEDDFDDD